jgi:hypothetical protein
MSRDLQQRIRALRSVERRLEPDAAWVRATRTELLEKVHASLPAEPVRTTRKISHFFRHFIPVQLPQIVRGPVMATIAIFVAALGGSVASVSAAERSLPGDFLYSLKLATEQARLAFTTTKEDKLKLKLEFTGRRGDELESVAKSDAPEKPVRVVQAAEILKRDLNTVKKQLDDVKTDASPKKVVEVAKLVDQATGKIVQKLQETKSDIPAEAKGKITEAQAAAADTGVKALEVLVETHQESSEEISETWIVQAIQDHGRVVADVTGNTDVVSSTAVTISSETSTSSISLPIAVEQMKVATQTAFAIQKTQEDLASSSTAAVLPVEGASSTSSGTEGTVSSTGAITPAASSSSTSSSSSSSSVQTVTPP